MEALYAKLYDKYSKLKSAKETQIDQINQEQEVKFVKYVSASDTLVNGLTAEMKKLTEDNGELLEQVMSLSNAKVQQIIDAESLVMEKNQRIDQLLAENLELRNLLKLRNLQQERSSSSGRSDQPEQQHVSSGRHSPTVSRDRTAESPMRMTRKRARLFHEPDSVTSSPIAGHVQLSKRRKLSADQPKSDHSKVECCQGIIVDGGAGKCMFHGLIECLLDMEVSVADLPEGKCICAVHRSSGYSFSLTWVNKEELMYRVISLGTLASVALEWMREDIMFSTKMCPIFFERLSRVIKQH